MSKIDGSSTNVQTFSPISSKASKLLDATIAPPKAAKVLGLPENTVISHRATAETPTHSSGIGDRIKSFLSGIRDSIAGFFTRADRAEAPQRLSPNALATSGTDTKPASETVIKERPFVDREFASTLARPKAEVSVHIGRWLDEIRNEAPNVKDKDGNPAPQTVEERRNDKIQNVLVTASALRFQALDLERLSGIAGELRAEGQTEKADFLDELVRQGTAARDPAGAKAMFWDEASSYMKVSISNESEFLRVSESTGAACVKKMMDAIPGVRDYQAQVTTKVEQFYQRTDVRELSAKLEKAGITNMTGTDIPKADAEKLFKLSAELLADIRTIPVPAEGKALLGELKAEIGDNEARKNKLYSDQTFLKMVSIGVTTYKDPETGNAPQILKLVWDPNSVAANGVADAVKYGSEARALYAEKNLALKTDIAAINADWGR